MLGSALSIVAACGGEDAVPTLGVDPTEVGDGGDAERGDAAHVDAPSTSNDGGAKDAALDSSDGGASDGGDASASLGPNPPAGFVACGMGSFSDIDARAACIAQGSVLDTPPSCDEAIGGGGTYRMFCKGDARWIWVQVVDVALAASATNCPSPPSYSLAVVAGQTFAGGGGWGGVGKTTLTPSGLLDPGKTMALTIEAALKPEHTRIAFFTFGYPFTAGCTPLAGSRVLRGTPWFEADP